MVPECHEQTFNRVTGPENASVDLGTSTVESSEGGSFHDVLEGGSARNTYKGGPGGSDSFWDFGGREADGTFPAVAASDATYKGFTSDTGNDRVHDYGGAAGRLDLRPLESSNVHFDAYDWDANGSNDSLKMVISDTTSVSVLGRFYRIPSQDQESGRVEQIIFADEVVTSAAEARTLTRVPSDREGAAAREE